MFGGDENQETRKTYYNEQPDIAFNQVEVHKMVPKKISLEKERLYEDTLHLKTNINQLVEENLKLKSRNQQLERDLGRLTKTLESMSGQGNANIYGARGNESSLTVSLKKQVKELKEVLAKKDEEIENWKRNTKVTKLQELEAEIRAFTDENIRLKGIIEKFSNERPQMSMEEINQLEEKYYMQNNLIDTLQRDNNRLLMDVKELERQCMMLQQDKEIDAKNYQKKNAELNRMRKHLKEKEKLLNKKIVESRKPTKGLGERESKAEDEEILKILAEKDAEIEKLEKIINSYENVMQFYSESFNWIFVKRRIEIVCRDLRVLRKPSQSEDTMNQ